MIETPEAWGRRQAALAPSWSDETWRLALSTLGLTLNCSDPTLLLDSDRINETPPHKPARLTLHRQISSRSLHVLSTGR